MQTYDIVVIGGGINGTGIAADAAGRGARVLLAEAADLGGATSSASSKLIHGGLRYLEHYAFRLVREALQEREVLLARAPHIIWPLRFVLPHVEGMRPAWMLRAGLFLYDHLARRQTLGGSRALELRADPAGAALRGDPRRGFSYYDCWVDDARLVILNAIAAREKGAVIQPRTRMLSAAVHEGAWHVTLQPSGAAAHTVRARVLVNAAGPWVAQVAAAALGSSAPVRAAGADGPQPVPAVRLVKGSHIVVPRLSSSPDAYILQNSDGRVVFALPFEQAFTLIGTTDETYTGDPRVAAPSAEEERYLIDVAQRSFKRAPQLGDIVWRYAGVRPLADDGAARAADVSRDYRLDLIAAPERPPLLNIVGGKITTYRTLAEAAVAKLQPALPHMSAAWTATAPLPGGDVGPAGWGPFLADAARRYPGLPPEVLNRLARRYGTRMDRVLGRAATPADLGPEIAPGLSQAELAYLKSEEWAQSGDDVLWRRTKAGVRVPAAERQRTAEAISAALARL